MTKNKDDWGDVETLPTKKRAIPTWLWFCSGGCLLVILLVIGAGVFLAGALERATDEEVQWALLAEVLPFDERPENLNLQMGIHILSYDQFQFLETDHGWQVVIVTIEGDEGEQARQELFYDEEVHFPDSVGGQVNFEGLDRGELMLPGRELAMLRMEMKIAGVLKMILPEEGLEAASGSMIFIDVTRDEGPFVYIQVQSSSSDRVSNEQLEELLSSFDLSGAGTPR